LTQIKDLNSIAYDGTFYAPIQRADGTTGKILISAIGSSLSSWQIKTANYTAVAGDRLRIDASVGDVIVTLPSTPLSSDADIWFQRLDSSAFKVLIRPGNNPINTQTGKDGIFAPLIIQLIERLSYVNSIIGWLGQFDRITYQAAPASAPAPDASALHLLFAKSLLDSSSTPKTITPNGVTISTTQTKYPSGAGNGAAYFDGSKAVGFPRDGVTGINIVSFTQWTLECWVYPTTFGASNNIIFATYNNVGGAQSGSFVLFLDVIFDGIGAALTFAPVLNVWQHYAIIYDKATNSFKGYYNGNLVGTTSASSFNAGASTNYIGGSPGDNNIGTRFFSGYIDDFIITPSIKYTANFTPTISALI